jgi:hypothetical protein
VRAVAAGTVPSIKGSVFGSVVEDARKLFARGELGRADAPRWLEPDDLRLLDSEIFVSHWYDIRAYARLSLLLRDVEGGGSNEFLRQKGRDTARRLLEAGLYAQLEYLQRADVSKTSDPAARFDAFGRDLRLLTTLSGSILNFSRWVPMPDPERAGRYLIEVSDAGEMPEVLCWRSDGFVNEMASQHGDQELWGWERPRPDLVLFRMTRSL